MSGATTLQHTLWRPSREGTPIRRGCPIREFKLDDGTDMRSERTKVSATSMAGWRTSTEIASIAAGWPASLRTRRISATNPVQCAS